jgi:hypothetical protein
VPKYTYRVTSFERHDIETLDVGIEVANSKGRVATYHVVAHPDSVQTNHLDGTVIDIKYTFEVMFLGLKHIAKAAAANRLPKLLEVAAGEFPSDAILRIKALRERTRCGLKDAKDAMEVSAWDIDKAETWLRDKDLLPK